MKPLKLAVVTALSLAVAGCAVKPIAPLGLAPTSLNGDLEGATQALLRESLKDPDSAQFRRLRALDGGNGFIVVCGELNGKNAFGGYVGFHPFYALLRPNGPGKYMPVSSYLEGSDEVDQRVFVDLYPACL